MVYAFQSLQFDHEHFESFLHLVLVKPSLNTVNVIILVRQYMMKKLQNNFYNGKNVTSTKYDIYVSNRRISNRYNTKVVCTYIYIGNSCIKP